MLLSVRGAGCLNKLDIKIDLKTDFQIENKSVDNKFFFTLTSLIC